MAWRPAPAIILAAALVGLATGAVVLADWPFMFTGSTLALVLGTAWLVWSGERGIDDDDDGGGGALRDPSGEPKPPRPAEPVWWPEFERQFAAYAQYTAPRSLDVEPHSGAAPAAPSRPFSA